MNEKPLTYNSYKIKNITHFDVFFLDLIYIYDNISMFNKINKLFRRRNKIAFC